MKRWLKMHDDLVAWCGKRWHGFCRALLHVEGPAALEITRHHLPFDLRSSSNVYFLASDFNKDGDFGDAGEATKPMLLANWAYWVRLEHFFRWFCAALALLYVRFWCCSYCSMVSLIRSIFCAYRPLSLSILSSYRHLTRRTITALLMWRKRFTTGG